MDNYLSANRAHWNEVVPSHAGSASYDVDGFKAGKNTLRSIEREELGDVSGKSLLHLQCHFGLDTMSWARLGAQATGIDFSQEAISLAQSLSRELGMDARFVCSDIYGLRGTLTGEFDIVFTSYGIKAWLPDMAEWARIAAHFLKPGGTFYMVELHPLGSMFEYDTDTGELTWAYSYSSEPQPLRCEDTHTYAASNAAVRNPVVYEWSHSLGEVVTSLINAGLSIEYLHEFPYCCYRPFPCMTRGDDGWWRLPEKYRDIPMLFSIKARKPA
jgi:SAM-dependent methyltransferase